MRTAGPLINLAWLRVAVKPPSKPVLQPRCGRTGRTAVHKMSCKVAFQVQTGLNNSIRTLSCSTLVFSHPFLWSYTSLHKPFATPCSISHIKQKQLFPFWKSGRKYLKGQLSFTVFSAARARKASPQSFFSHPPFPSKLRKQRGMETGGGKKFNRVI